MARHAAVVEGLVVVSVHSRLDLVQCMVLSFCDVLGDFALQV